MGKVKKAFEGKVFLKGFTHIAQAFTLAEVFLLDGRQMSQSAVLTSRTASLDQDLVQHKAGQAEEENKMTESTALARARCRPPLTRATLRSSS